MVLATQIVLNLSIVIPRLTTTFAPGPTAYIIVSRVPRRLPWPSRDRWKARGGVLRNKYSKGRVLQAQPSRLNILPTTIYIQVPVQWKMADGW